jgi:hypothetical protein
LRWYRYRWSHGYLVLQYRWLDESLRHLRVQLQFEIKSFIFPVTV